MSKNLERSNASSSASDDSNRREAQAGSAASNDKTPRIASIALPKGGGAIQGVGEKFTANPVTGTGALNVPLATSPGRSGFGPQLSPSYDSGAGNGPFGFGWTLSLPNITRKTAKGLPKYRDAEDSDVFILSGAEDLVPVLVEARGQWEPEPVPPQTVNGQTYRIKRYRPRIEGLFARIERWTSLLTGDSHWRSITSNNITTIFGQDDNSRVFAPIDQSAGNHSKRIFTWLISQSYDDKGNVISYEYAEENDRNVDRTKVNERNRVRTINRYPKRIKYGNRTSRLIQPDLSRMEWLFEVVFDYDEDHYEALPFDPALRPAEQHLKARAASVPGKDWAIRPDPFSANRAGYEIRTYRRCHRVLMFHRFNELGDEPYLVRSTEFDYTDLDYSRPITIEEEIAHQGSTRVASFIRSVTQSGFVRDGGEAIVRNGIHYLTYLKKSLPSVEFEYTRATVESQIESVAGESLDNLPVGLYGKSNHWVDLDGEGAPGILAEQAGAWFYKRNWSPLPIINSGESKVAARFGALESLSKIPMPAKLSDGQVLMDLAGDGQIDVADFDPPTPGFFERTTDEDWENFRSFEALPNIHLMDPNIRFVDLTGDGLSDVLITEDEVFTWYSSLAEQGFAPAEKVRQALDEETGPRVLFADGTQSIYLADMSGDGLTDIVRIRNGEVCYWANIGYGRFAAKVTMDNAPWFDAPDQFAQSRIRLADIDGSGVIDIIYLGRTAVHLYFNQSGNRWSNRLTLKAFPDVDDISAVSVRDLLGNGTACLVWSSPLPADERKPMRYIRLMRDKPYLLTRVTNNLGAETRIHYAPSTKFYLQDKAAGRPWLTRIPFPVHVVERAGAISEWEIALSEEKELRQFDYSTIADVILHLNYTARESGGLFKEKATTHMRDFLLNALDLADQPLLQMLNLKHDFSTEWYKFLHPGTAESAQELKFTVGKERFPFFVQDRGITIMKIELFARCTHAGDYFGVLSYNDFRGRAASFPEITMGQSDAYGGLNKGTIAGARLNLDQLDVTKELTLRVNRHSASETPPVVTPLGTNPDEIEEFFMVFHYKLTRLAG